MKPELNQKIDVKWLLEKLRRSRVKGSILGDFEYVYNLDLVHIEDSILRKARKQMKEGK